ncbi:MAG: livG [Alphaproteobacteria bacterium]|nr:livG [Alphaproteobacteria bacterium]
MSAPAMSPATADDILSARNLTRRFGGLVAVSDFSFTLKRGEILGLIGPNGAGKSTVFNLISGFIPPTAGQLSFDGTDITKLRAPAISRLGLVRMFQHGSLVPDMSVYENILLATLVRLRTPSTRDARVRETAAMFGLTPYLEELGGNLSHGRQRLLAMAIATATRPRLLCLDEPLTGLNSTETRDILELFRKLRAEMGMTVLLVEHNMRAVMSVCDRLIVLHHGQRLAEGTPAEISRDENVIGAYLGKRS